MNWKLNKGFILNEDEFKDLCKRRASDQFFCEYKGKNTKTKLGYKIVTKGYKIFSYSLISSSSNKQKMVHDKIFSLHQFL